MNLPSTIPPEADPDIVPPHAAALAESLRAFSYDLPTAIADLVDNSITAQAKKIWVDFHWDGQNSVVMVTDDGNGMSEKVLISAMRPGSQNPLEKRHPKDLGRFGLGLKTASFSQCRRVTVRSKTSPGDVSTRCWDLDYIKEINEWKLQRIADPAAEVYLKRLGESSKGTSVLWQNLDRLGVAGQRADHERGQRNFLQLADAVRNHLAMVFHQLMTGRGKAVIFINDRAVEPWDPFLSEEPATQILPTSRLQLRNAIVEVQPFILPHHSRISSQMHDAAAGPHGWSAQQGFYVYRNRRLLVAGDWLGLGWAKEDHYKLARIRIELPNELDQDWGIDVTKSRARPPMELRDELQKIGRNTREKAKRIYSHRGASLAAAADQDRVLMWKHLASHDRTFHRLNREHPLLVQALEKSTDRPALNALLRLIEETVPLPLISINNSDQPTGMPTPFEGVPDSEIRAVMKEAFEAMIISGYKPRDAAERMRTMWPFELFPALLQSLIERQNSI